MVLKKELGYEKGPAPVDDSWWNAVLEEVETLFSAKTKIEQPLGGFPEDKNQSAADEINWEYVENLYKQDEVVRLEVTNHNRGGLLVKGNGIQGFVPASHLVSLSKKKTKKDREAVLSPYVGRALALKVIECEAERGRIVLSERAAQTDSGSRLTLFNTLKVGDKLRGSITTITNFGVFVDLGGVEGLIHISELSWGRVIHPSELVSLGDEIEVSILQIDPERTRVALSAKRLNPNPWDSIHDNFYPGQIINAEITNIVSYGAFARLKDGIDGLIHISEFNKTGPTNAVDDLLREGQQVEVCILHIDSKRQRLGLSLYTGSDGVR